MTWPRCQRHMGLAKGAGLVIMLAVIKGVSHAIVGQMLAASTKSIFIR